MIDDIMTLMGNIDFWARCQDCGAETRQGDTRCPKCGSTKVVHEVTVSDGLVLRDGLGTKHKKKGVKRPLAESRCGWKPSGDHKLKKGVYEDIVVDREKGEYHHIVKDAATGKVTHEEHQRLSEHNKKVKTIEAEKPTEA